MLINKVNFQVHLGNQVTNITEAELGPYASFLGLDRIAPSRYSWLFVLDLYLNDRFQGIDPIMVMEELKGLEAGHSTTTGTKPPRKFKRPPLKGLWHKHYFSAHFVPTNILNHLSGDKMMKLAERIFDSSISPVTEKMVAQFAHEVSHGSLDARANAKKLTGEWIVFAKHDSQNYYLRLTTHNHGDQKLYDSLKSICLKEFPFLQLWEPPPPTGNQKA